MSRNELCPCGSGKKLKKCCGAAAKHPQQPSAAAPRRPAEQRAPAAVPAVQRPATLFTPSLRRASTEQVEEERKKHLKRRTQSRDLRGTLVYNTGEAFRTRSSRTP